MRMIDAMSTVLGDVPLPLYVHVVILCTRTRDDAIHPRCCIPSPYVHVVILCTRTRMMMITITPWMCSSLLLTRYTVAKEKELCMH